MEKILYTYAAMVLCTISGVAAYNLIPWEHMTSSDWATWVGAIGTLLAFGGTIWLATQETRRRNHEAYARARIAAPAFIMKLLGLRICIVHAISHLNGTPDRELVQFCGGQIQAAPLWTLDEIAPMLSLPNECAIDLALVKTLAETTGKYLSDPPGGMEKFVPDTVIQLRNALVHLDKALRTCHSLFDEVAPGSNLRLGITPPSTPESQP